MLLSSVIRRHLWLFVSLTGNGALAAALVASWFWQVRRHTVVEFTPAGGAAATAVDVPQKVMPALVPASEGAKVAAFHWSQLEAPDFPAFVKNLRDVACPERTIHDIIAGELREIYAAKRLSAEQAVAGAPEGARDVLQQRFLALEAEEAAVLASLTARAPTPEAAFASTSSMAEATAGIESEMTPAAPAQTAARDSLLVPAAFLVGDDPAQATGFSELSVAPTDTSLDPVVSGAIIHLRNTFAASMPQEGPAADHSSMFYRMHWQAAQRQNDEAFSSLLGGDAFLNAQSQAMRKQQQHH